MNSALGERHRGPVRADTAGTSAGPEAVGLFAPALNQVGSLWYPSFDDEQAYRVFLQSI